MLGIGPTAAGGVDDLGRHPAGENRPGARDGGPPGPPANERRRTCPFAF
ncbi:MAG: hypothetical protein AVDCRST_MAG02-2928 [uncultured Rubrobacteraceae bacterium]|uniref:Uncharacterized protein n=1 Tax=uncultured Rubrobacteraceae bacterium TaxID=349277 RepID=A0A6J4R793_9ACTN|nr:MAG: hypothetical protein AVDCRST_MAG02-2928 [uncultured Rubrobacteraceae bacterium]